MTSLLPIFFLLLLFLWVWIGWRTASEKRNKTLAYVLVFLTFDLILFGAFTRLTDSGLGCPDWPGCYANATPIGAAAHIEAAQSLMPTGPVTHIKAWIEMLHRYFATAVGALILLRLIWSVRLKQKLSLPVVTFLWVCVQGVFGALTVTMKLFPLIVTLHLLGGVLLLALLAAQLERKGAAVQRALPAQRYGPWLAAAMVAVWLQIALGAWVSSNYAVLACSEFPTCLNGAWFPASGADWSAGFTLWRALGQTAADATVFNPLAFSALTAIQLTHRLFAGVVVVTIACLIIQLKSHPALRTLKLWLMALLTLQIITGISSVVLGWPLLAALMHTGGAAGLILALTQLWAVKGAE